MVMLFLAMLFSMSVGVVLGYLLPRPKKKVSPKLPSIYTRLDPKNPLDQLISSAVKIKFADYNGIAIPSLTTDLGEWVKVEGSTDYRQIQVITTPSYDGAGVLVSAWTIVDKYDNPILPWASQGVFRTLANGDSMTWPQFGFGVVLD